MRTVGPNAAEHGCGQERGETAYHQDPDARTKELRCAVVRHRLYLARSRLVHHKRSCVQRHAASMAYTTTPVTETYSQMGSVKRAILRCCRNRPLSAKKNVVSTIGSATTDNTM
jgi:hypothetical protein